MPILTVYKPERGMPFSRRTLPPPPAARSPDATLPPGPRPGLERCPLPGTTASRRAPHGPLLRGPAPRPRPRRGPALSPARLGEPGPSAGPSLHPPAARTGCGRPPSVRGAGARGPPRFPAAGPPPWRGGAGASGRSAPEGGEEAGGAFAARGSPDRSDKEEGSPRRGRAELTAPKLTRVCSCHGRPFAAAGSLRPLLVTLEPHPTGETKASKGKAHASCSTRW